MPEHTSHWQKLKNLTGLQWVVIIQAPWVLLLTWTRLRALGYQETLRRIRHTQRSPVSTELQLARAKETAYALAVAVKFGPWAPKCLLRSLALGWLLARRGIPFELRIGIPAGKGGSHSAAPVDFNAHAWVECSGVVLNDKATIADDFSVFAGAGGE